MNEAKKDGNDWKIVVYLKRNFISQSRSNEQFWERIQHDGFELNDFTASTQKLENNLDKWIMLAMSIYKTCSEAANRITFCATKKPVDPSKKYSVVNSKNTTPVTKSAYKLK